MVIVLIKVFYQFIYGQSALVLCITVPVLDNGFGTIAGSGALGGSGGFGRGGTCCGICGIITTG